MKIIILDDDKDFVDYEKRMIEHYLATKDIIAETKSHTKLRKFLQDIRENTYDIIFLDIELDESNGFELARTIRKRYEDSSIVFVSSHEHLVYDCFEYFPLKFIRKKNFKKELPSVFAYMESNKEIRDRYIALETSDGTIKCCISDIYYIESYAHHTKVYTRNNMYINRQYITSMEEQLKPWKFIRCNRFYLVNFKHISRLVDDQFVLDDKRVVHISRRKLKETREEFNTYLRNSLC